MKSDKSLKATVAEILTKLKRNDNVIILLSKDQLTTLAETVTKNRDELRNIPSDRLSLLIKHLRQNIFAGLSNITNERNPQNGSVGCKPLDAMEAGILIVQILSTPNIPSEIYYEKVIDHVVHLARCLLEQKIYPSFDGNYVSCGAAEPIDKGNKTKKIPPKTLVDKSTQNLYAKMVVFVDSLAEYFHVERMDKSNILMDVIKLSVEPFFVEAAIELCDPSLKVLNQTFAKYEISVPIWEHLISTSMRLTGHKRASKWIPLEPESSTKVAAFSALVLQLLQNVVSTINTEAGANPETLDVGLKKSQDLTDAFLEVFVTRMIGKWDDRDSRHLLDMFIIDIIAAAFHPQWPIAETVVNKLGTYLHDKITSDSIDPARLTYFEMFGFVTTKICQNAGRLKSQAGAMNDLLQIVREELDAGVENNDDTTVPSQTLDRVLTTRMLQNAILANLAPTGTGIEENPSEDSRNSSARLYCIALWANDLRSAVETIDCSPESPGKGGNTAKRRTCQTEKLLPEVHLLGKSRDILLAQVNATPNSGDRKLTQAEIPLASRYVAVSRAAFKTCNWYLDQLLALKFDATMTVRNRVTRFLRQLIEMDTDLLGLTKIQRAILTLLSDKAASVRETTVDMVGKIILLKPEMINIVFTPILKMLKDTSMCVKKRCVRFLREIAMACPDYPHLPAYSARVLSLIFDEGTQKTVMETLEQLWFTTPMSQSQLVSRTIAIVTVGTSYPVDFQAFLEVLVSDRDGKTDSIKVPPPSSTITACHQITQRVVNCLTSNNRALPLERSQLLATLFYMTKALPQLGIKHSAAVLNFVDSTGQTEEEGDELRFTAQILELTLPSMKAIDPKVAANAERAFIEALGPKVQDSAMVATCVTCLAMIARRITKNYSPIKKLFRKSMNAIKDYKRLVIDEPSSADEQPQESPSRHMFIAAMILRRFDVVSLGFSDTSLGKFIVKECLEVYCAVARSPIANGINVRALKSIGWILIRHPHQMMTAEVRNLYRDNLLACSLHGDDSTKVKNDAACIQALENIDFHINEEEILNAMGAAEPSEEVQDDTDECQNMARSLVSIHLREIFMTTFSTSDDVRKAASKLMQSIVMYGVVGTHQVISHLIMMCSDPCTDIAKSSLKLLTNFNKIHPEYLPTKLIEGVKMLYRFLAELQSDPKEDIVRGRKGNGDSVSAVISGVYSLICHSKPIRRAFIDSMLKLFDQYAKTPLKQLVFLADILAHLPYQVMDEPMYLISRLDLICSLTGGDLADDWNEMGVSPESCSSESDQPSGLTAASAAFRRECIARSHSYRLLVTLRAFVKMVFSITDSKMAAYSMTQLKPLERQATRRPRPPFEPTAVLDVIRQEGSNDDSETSDAELAQEIFDLKHMMMGLDPMDVESLESFDRKVAVMNKSIQRTHTSARWVSAAGSAVKRDLSEDQGTVEGEKAEGPKKRKIVYKMATSKEEEKLALAREPIRGRKMTAKRLF